MIIGFSRPSKWFAPVSWAIRLLQRTEYSHVYVRWYNPKLDSWFCYHATLNGLEFLGHDAYKKQLHVVEEYDIMVPMSSDMKKFCIDNAGGDYASLQLVGQLLVEMGIVKKNPLADGDLTRHCVELVAELLQLEDFDAESRNVKDLNKLIKELPNVKRMENGSI